MSDNREDNDVPGCSKDSDEMQKQRQRDAARIRQQRKRARESSTSRERRLAKMSEAKKHRESDETDEARALRLRKQAEGAAQRKSLETEEARVLRLRKDVEGFARRVSVETPEKKAQRLSQNAQTNKVKRDAAKLPTRTATDFDVDMYRLGDCAVKCVHCGAKHFPEERVQNSVHKDSFGDCCAHGKIKYVNGQIAVNKTDEQEAAYPESFKELFLDEYPEKTVSLKA